MVTLKTTFNPADVTARGSLFTLGNETYLRVKVENPTRRNAGLVWVYLTSLVHLEGKNSSGDTLICGDALKLNWAYSGGGERPFYGGLFHYCDILRFTHGEEGFSIMTARVPAQLSEELKKIGVYRLTFLVTGEVVKPMKYSLNFEWQAAKGYVVSGLKRI